MLNWGKQIVKFWHILNFLINNRKAGKNMEIDKKSVSDYFIILYYLFFFLYYNLEKNIRRKLKFLPNTSYN